MNFFFETKTLSISDARRVTIQCMLWPTGLSPVCGKPNIGRFDGCVTALREIEARFSIANRLGAWSANPHVPERVIHMT